ncbi:hypothetical protein CTAYLR_006888 [Chrysophaeum taylorii]|uniref:Uncharacterized protein n=1 Tax=Chrysophaeum taylorii TaxID=2483200 RepID=A0AAD7XLR5_9STRA|nr:hypothetical protein CTAYLR_006888 [Chrysophaeum taylorii]
MVRRRRLVDIVLILATRVTRADEDGPTPVPSLDPTVVVPEWAKNVTCSAISSAKEIEHCYEEHDGVCVTSVEECTSVYSGSVPVFDGCGYPEGKACFCCHGASSFKPSPVPTVAPSTGLPAWVDEATTCARLLDGDRTRACWNNHHGICVESEAECELFAGTFANGTGCDATSGSGCACCRDAYTFLPTATPSISPTVELPVWVESGTTCASSLAADRTRACWENHRGVCVADEAECELFGGTFANGTGCDATSGSGCACCRDAYTLLPTRTPTVSPSAALPAWVDEATTCARLLGGHHTRKCWENHHGVCVDGEDECDLFGGTFVEDGGCGSDSDSGCSCCRDAYSIPPSPIPTPLPTDGVPEWVFNVTECADGASRREVIHCWEHHHGVCVGSDDQCAVAFEGSFANTTGCGGPEGSGCSCCHDVYTFLPTTAPTVATTAAPNASTSASSSKKKKSNDDDLILILIIILLLICVCINCCIIFFFCCRKKDEEVVEEQKAVENVMVDSEAQTDEAYDDDEQPEEEEEEEEPLDEVLLREEEEEPAVEQEEKPADPESYFEAAAFATDDYQSSYAPEPAYEQRYGPLEEAGFEDFDNELLAPIPKPVAARKLAKKKPKQSRRAKAKNDDDDDDVKNNKDPKLCFFCADTTNT